MGSKQKKSPFRKKLEEFLRRMELLCELVVELLGLLSIRINQCVKEFCQTVFLFSREIKWLIIFSCFRSLFQLEEFWEILEKLRERTGWKVFDIGIKFKRTLKVPKNSLLYSISTRLWFTRVLRRLENTLRPSSYKFLK